MSRDHYLEASDTSGLERYAKEQGFIADDESLRFVSKAGEGNMNLTLRLVTDRRSFILKQARPWVEKYPQIPAPQDRALVEIAFYEAATSRPALRDAMPKLLARDTDARVIVLEDLGDSGDFTSLYSGERLSESHLESLVAYLVALHRPWDELREEFKNREMRALNHEHIFRLPLAPDNGIDLDGFSPGLQAASASLKNNPAYVERVTALGELYLADGDFLLHGDYFPGSWLHKDSGVRIIDPEFCFIGPRAFDLGVMLGHLHLADQSSELADRLLEGYGADAETRTLARQFAGVEIMRRLIGVAQLPLRCGIEDKRALLDLSRELVLTA